MGILLKSLLALAILGTASGTVNFVHEFHENHGWEVTCKWQRNAENEMFDNITIWRNDAPIIVYKPPADNKPYANTIRGAGYDLSYNCAMVDNMGQGKCVIVVNVTANATEDFYKAQAHWGPPPAKIESAEKDVFAKSSSPKMMHVQKAGEKYTINCTSRGVPAPYLVWTMSEGKTVKELQAAANMSVWNETTKYWDSWSVFKATDDKKFKITCTPKQLTRKGEVAGEADFMVVNSAGILGVPGVLAVIVAPVALLLLFAQTN